MGQPRPGSRALRSGRVSTPGQIYLVTTATRERIPVFRDWYAGAQAARVTMDTNVLGNSRFLAWVLVPDHFHGLLMLGEGAQLADVMRRFKGSVAYRVNRLSGSSGALWQPSFHDHALRTEEDLAGAARYIVANPVRAGLVTCVAEYPFWNAEWLDGRGAGRG